MWFRCFFNGSPLKHQSIGPAISTFGWRTDILYEVPVGIIVLLSIFYGSISIIAVIGNSLVIWIVATTRQMQTVTNLFIANLALADVVIGMFVIPFQVSFTSFRSFFLFSYRLCVCSYISVVVFFCFQFPAMFTQRIGSIVIFVWFENIRIILLILDFLFYKIYSMQIYSCVPFNNQLEWTSELSARTLTHTCVHK